MGALPLGPLGATCTILATLDLLPLRMIPTKFGWNLIISFEEKYQNKDFPCSPPPPACYPHRAPMGPPTEMPWTTFILHLERYLHTIYQVCPTSRSGEEDVWNLHSFYPWGPSPWALPLGATCTILSTLDLLPLRMIPTKFGWNLIISFEEKYQNKNFPCSAPPPPACYPHRAPMGPPTEMSWTTFIVHLERYLHTIYQVCPTSRSGEEDVWNLHSFYPWGPSPWAPWGLHAPF